MAGLSFEPRLCAPPAAGVLSGALVSGVQMAVSMSNTGGAWDNAKKYIEVRGPAGLGLPRSRNLNSAALACPGLPWLALDRLGSP